MSTEKHPFSAADLRRLHATTISDPLIAELADTLAIAWPMLVPGTHRLEFEGGRVVLTLIFADALDSLPTLRLRADAFYLDGFAPAKNPELWSPAIFRSLARVAGDDATFSTYSSAGDVKRALTQCGFEYRKVDGFGWKRAMLVGRFAPRWRVRRYEPPAPFGHDERHAVVIGAGLAGCAVIERLAARGWRVTSLERHVHFEDLGSLELVLGERGRPVRYLDVGVARIEAPNPVAASLIVVLGGPISATDDALYPTLAPLLSLIEKRIAAGLPTLGICLGAQLIARALGARVYAAAQAELGWTPLKLTDAGRASPLRHLDGAHTSMLHWHGDTFDLPANATRLASTPACENQAFA